MPICLLDSSLLRRRVRPGYSGYWRRMVVPLALLLVLVAPVSQAAGCVWYDEDSFGDAYLKFGSSNFLDGGITPYADSNCQTPHDWNATPHDGLVHASNVRTAWSICEANNNREIGYVDLYLAASEVYYCEATDAPRPLVERTQRVGLVSTLTFPDADSALARCRVSWPETNRVYTPVESYPNQWACIYAWTVRSGSRDGGPDRGGSAYFRDIPNLPLIGLKLRAFDGPNSGIEFRRLTQFYVGIRSVLDMGVVDAVDVWSNIGSGYEVCFPLPGRIVFLDAATSPRTVVPLESSYADDYTCASSDRAGTMVLVESGESESSPVTPSESTRRPGTNDSVDTAIALENCIVTPRYNLRLRAAPWGRILDVVPVGTAVVATARTQSWFQITYEEQAGWIAAWLVDTDGDCDWPAPEDADAVSA